MFGEDSSDDNFFNIQTSTPIKERPAVCINLDDTDTDISLGTPAKKRPCQHPAECVNLDDSSSIVWSETSEVDELRSVPTESDARETTTFEPTESIVHLDDSDTSFSTHSEQSQNPDLTAADLVRDGHE